MEGGSFSKCERRAHSFETFESVSRIEGGSFSKCGSRFSATHIRFKHMQEFHGLRAGRFQNAALAALAPRALVLNI
eukprot:8222774-Pyramimonas_sp.AAC.1